MTKSKIIATLGPASSTAEMILALAKAGADLFRLNMSHGDPGWHKKTIRLIRRVTAGSGAGPTGIIADLAGPKIRVGELEGGSVTLKTGGRVLLHNRREKGAAGSLPVLYDGLGTGLRRGARVLIDDGMIELRVVSSSPGEADCRVVKGGVVKERKGVNFPGLPLELPSLTDKDLADLGSVLAEGVDYIALSFVRGPEDVLALKERLARAGSDVPVIAKIERPEAVKNIREIVRVADGIMVARGDLGVEMPPERVPPIQKMVIRLCNEMRKPVITATQMLESMVVNPRPTRAEASDVAGAVFDGTDALMLSGETATGAYPAAAVTMMDKIAREAERHVAKNRFPHEPVATVPEAIAHSAGDSATALSARAIICFTRSGATALLMSKFRPGPVIIAATPDEAAFRRMRLYHGVVPLMVRLRPQTDAMLGEVEAAVLKGRLLKKGDLTVVTLGVPAKGGETNLMKVHRIGEGSRA